MMTAVERVHGHVVERIVHEAHVPFEAEAQSAVLRRGAYLRECGRFLGYRHGAGVIYEHRGIQLLQECDCVEVYIPAVSVRRKLAGAAAVVEIQHRAYRVYTDAVYVIFLEEFAGRRNEEALHLIRRIVEHQSSPFGVLRHAALLALKEGSAVKIGKPVLVLREMRGHPVHDDADAGVVQLVHKVFEIVRIAVARGRGVIPRDLIAPAPIVGVLRDGHKLHVRKAHVLAVDGERIGKLAVGGLLAAQLPP